MGNTNDDQLTTSEEQVESPALAKSAGFTLGQEPLVGTEPEVAKFEVAPATTPAPPPLPVAAEAAPEFESLGELPTTYNFDTLFLTARDPRWLFCYWDFDWTRIPSGAFRYGVPMFYLKISRVLGGEETTLEIKPEARNWYVPVNSANTLYFAELGYFNNEGTFVTCVRSAEAATPAEQLAPEQPVTYATVPPKLSFEALLDLVKSDIQDGESLLQAVARVTGEGTIAFRAGQAPIWTDEQRRLLSALLGSALIDRMGLGSAEIDELLRKTLLEKLYSETSSGFSSVWQRAMGVPGESSLFSGSMGAWSGVTSWGLGSSWSAQPFSTQFERGFFMHVNAEVIFYGGTHPDATVWIDGKQIQLSPDGTFRYHFRMPDGDWNIPIIAQSPDKFEQRSATLNFQRATVRLGDVGDTPQPQHLPPEPMGRKS